MKNTMRVGIALHFLCSSLLSAATFQSMGFHSTTEPIRLFADSDRTSIPTFCMDLHKRAPTNADLFENVRIVGDVELIIAGESVSLEAAIEAGIIVVRGKGIGAVNELELHKGPKYYQHVPAGSSVYFGAPKGGAIKGDSSPSDNWNKKKARQLNFLSNLRSGIDYAFEKGVPEKIKRSLIQDWAWLYDSTGDEEALAIWVNSAAQARRTLKTVKAAEWRIVTIPEAEADLRDHLDPMHWYTSRRLGVSQAPRALEKRAGPRLFNIDLDVPQAKFVEAVHLYKNLRPVRYLSANTAKSDANYKIVSKFTEKDLIVFLSSTLAKPQYQHLSFPFSTSRADYVADSKIVLLVGNSADQKFLLEIQEMSQSGYLRRKAVIIAACDHSSGSMWLLASRMLNLPDGPVLVGFLDKELLSATHLAAVLNRGFSRKESEKGIPFIEVLIRRLHKEREMQHVNFLFRLSRRPQARVIQGNG